MNYPLVPPTYSPCFLCQNKCKGTHLKAPQEVEYSCPKHEGLIVSWFCIKTVDKVWKFTRLTIALENHFRLYYDFSNAYYMFLYEWIRANEFGPESYWKIVDANPSGSFKAVMYKPEFILSKSDKQLLTFFQMHKMFL